MTRMVRFGSGLFLIVNLVGVEAATARGAAEPAAGSPAPAAANKPAASAREVGPVNPGRLRGTVTDAAGMPLDETLISATGPSGTALVVCDADGRFEFPGLRPGSYLLRAHVNGFKPADRSVVQVRSGLATTHAVTLRRVDAELGPSPVVLAAGFVPTRRSARAPVEPEAVQPAEGSIPGLTVTGSESDPEHGVAPHDDSAKAWWLRRARRSVLKDADIDLIDLIAIETPGFGEPTSAQLGFGSESETRSPTAELSPSFPLTGQFHLLTRTSLHSPHEFRTSNILPGQIAYVSLGGVEAEQPWGVRGAVRTGDAGSWVLSGAYRADPSPTHELAVGMSYSRQRVQAGIPGVIALPGEPGEPSSQPHRDARSVRADGHWAVNPRVTLDYAANVAGYGYLEQAYLFSPSAAVTLTPIDGTRIRVAMSQYMLAPGAEEFLPPSEGVWLPPERTFAPLVSTDPLHAERSRHFEVAVEHDVGGASTLGLRRFAQDVNNQIVTLFGVRPVPAVSSEHYYMASAGGVATDGWAVMFAHEVGDRFTGSVDYSVIDARWTPWTAGALSSRSVGLIRSGAERLHDITTSIEAAIPESATRVLLLYRFNSAFSNQDVDAAALQNGFGGRFALRVRQTLPFSPIEGSKWEVLVDIRSMFREQVAGASVYDELLVVSPPKEVVGGLVVNF